MHKLLSRQIRRHLGADPALREALAGFLGAVEATYEQNDADRAMLDHSMNTVSQEMLERNRLLRASLVQREQHEKELAVALGMLRGTLESTADGVLVVDRDGRIVLTNARFSEMWRIPSELFEQGIDEPVLAHKTAQVADPDGFVERIRTLNAEPLATSADEVVFKDGRVFERFSKPLMVGGVASGRVWSFHDVTGLRALQQQLIQSQKMQAIGQLAGGVAHDFNNLLTVIFMHCDFMSALPDQPWGGEIAAIDDAAQRAGALTRQLLAFSRKQVLKPVALDLADVVAGVEPMLRRLIPENVAIRTVTRDRGAAIADPRQIEQVLVNLAVNARDAMPDGGILTIRTSCIDLDDADPHVACGALRPGPYAMLTVGDTGTGMTPEVRTRVFEPFFSTKEPGKGTGLGLSTVYGIVTQSGGQISVYSEPGEGSLFKIYLPASDGRPKVQPAPPQREPARGHETILLVEDEDPLRLAAKRALERSGYSVVAAHNGREALMFACDTSRHFDLLLTDVVMPGLGGKDLAIAVRAKRPGLPVLFMSGYTDDDIFSRGYLTGDAAFIEKPFTTHGLTSAVRNALRSRAEAA